MTRWTLLLSGSLLLSTLGVAAAETDAVLVKQLVRQLLEGSTVENRDQAERDLTAMGPAVLQLLPVIDARTSGELKQRLLRIRAQLEAKQLTQFVEASRVTLQGSMTLSEAFASIEQQTGNTILDYRSRFGQESSNTQVTVELVNTEFWEALDTLLDEAGLTLNSYVGESRKLAVISAGETALPRHGRCAYAGLFRIEPMALTAERNLRDPSGDTLRMLMEIVWEPRVVPILIQQDLAGIEITMDNGESLTVAQGGTIQLPVQPGVAAVEIRLPLQLPARDTTQIRSLRGEFTALVPGGTVSFEFDNLETAQNQQQRKGGMTVMLDQVRRNGGVQQISVRLRFDQASPSLQSHLDWVENNVAKLIDADGHEADPPGLEKYLERPNEVGYSYLFPVREDLRGWKFVYETPAGMAEIPVSYELTDIPLP